MEQPDEAAIVAGVASFSEAWSRGDAKAAASFYTEDGVRVGAMGDVQHGRAAIEAAYDKLLHGPFRGAKVEQERGSVRMLGEGLALWQGGMTITPAHGPAQHGYVVQLMKKVHGRWLVLEAHPKLFPPPPPPSPPAVAKDEPTVVTFTSPDGTRIGCTRTGSGPPLVLVHGTAADHARWAPVLAPLEARFSVYACDRRGRGTSGDATRYAIEREFEDVAAIVDGIGGPVILLGHSYGALCSLEASLLTKNLHRLVLYEPPVPAGVSIYPEGTIERLEALLGAGDRDELVTTFMREIPRVPVDQLALLRSRPAWQARVAAAHTIPRELRAHETYKFEPARFRLMRTPTLLLLGGDSPPFFRAALERVQGALPKARLAVMPGQQHAAMDTGTDLFLREVLGSCAKCSASWSRDASASAGDVRPTPPRSNPHPEKPERRSPRCDHELAALTRRAFE